MQKQKIWNVPNALTMLRMLLIPVYWALFFGGDRLLALCVYIVASLTDWLDGYIARKYALVTDFGKLMDPLADKLMVVSVMVSLSIAGIAPWQAVAIVLVKELLMVLGGAFMLRKGIVVYSAMIGKAAQCLFILSLGLCFFHEAFAAWNFPLHLILLWISVALTLGALVFYAREALRKLRAQRA